MDGETFYSWENRGGIETAPRLSGIDSCADLMKVCN